MPGAMTGPEHEAADGMSRDNVFGEIPCTGSALLAYQNIGASNSAGRISCLVVDHANSAHWVASTHTGGIWHSWNAGSTWTPADDRALPLRALWIDQDAEDPALYYFCAFDEIEDPDGQALPDVFRSEDGGLTWAPINAPPSAVRYSRKVVCSPTTGGLMYTMGSTLGSIHRTVDGGQSFEVVFTPPEFPYTIGDIEVLPDGQVFVAVDSSIYRSPNGDPGTFSLATTGLAIGQGYGLLELGYCASQPDRLYAASFGSGNIRLHASSDGGDSWSFLNSWSPGIQTENHVLAVAPSDPDMIFIGSITLYCSLDGGQTVQYYNARGVDHWSTTFDPDDPSILYLAHDQGIKRCDIDPFEPDPAIAMTSMDSLFYNQQIYAGHYFPNGAGYVSGSQDIGTHWRNDPPSTTVVTLQGNDGSYCAVHQQDPQVVYYSDQFSLYKRAVITDPLLTPALGQMDADNNGQVDDVTFFINPFAINLLDGQQLYYCTRKRLWRTTDGALNWTPLTQLRPTLSASGTDGGVAVSHDLDPTVYWCRHDSIFRIAHAATADTGSEVGFLAPVPVEDMLVHPTNDSILYCWQDMSHDIPAGLGRIFRTANAFAEPTVWDDITGDLPEYTKVRWLEIDPLNDQFLIVATTHGLWTTSDGGAHWTNECDFPVVRVDQLRLRQSDRRLFIFSYGRGAWTAELPLGTGLDDHTGSSLRARLSSYPMPATEHMNLAWSGHVRDAVIMVFSFSGQLVARFDGVQGTSCDLPCGSWQSGTYRIVLKVDDRIVGVMAAIKI